MTLTYAPNESQRGAEIQGLGWSIAELRRIAERLTLSGREADAIAVLRTCHLLEGIESTLPP